MTDPSLPSADLLRQQAAWLAPARARLLRRVEIARRRRVLDLACGHGAVTGELVRRSVGPVLAVDRDLRALAGQREAFRQATRLCADATRLPLADRSFDLVFCQFAMLWLDAAGVVGEVRRVLEPGGVLVALEPDYGGMIESPPQIATQELWLSALARTGADPEIGRKLPGLLAAAGFGVRVDLLDRLTPPSSARFDYLRCLPLNERERHALEKIEAADRACRPGDRVVHLPVFLLTATR